MNGLTLEIAVYAQSGGRILGMATAKIHFFCLPEHCFFPYTVF